VAARRGRTIAFESEADLLAAGAEGRQIFVGLKLKWKKGFLPLRQVTRGTGDSFGPRLNARGKYLVFSSTADLLAQGVTPGVHLYRAELRRLEKSACPGYPCPLDGNPGLELVTAAAAAPEINARGDRIAFTSADDPAGTGCGAGIAQVFVRDMRAGTITQLTCGAAESRRPVFTGDGRAVLFESDADLAGSGSTRTQIFVLNLEADVPQAIQLTFGTDGDSGYPVPTGTRTRNRFFFRSTADLTGAGAAGVERVFVFDDQDGLTRLTNGEDVLAGPTGRLVFGAFVSDGDLAGTGNADPQVFLVNASPLLGPVFVEPTPMPTPVLESITLAPASVTRAVGQSERYTATGHYSGGGTQNMTQQLTYGTGNAAVAVAPNEAGDRSRIEAVGAGTTTVTAIDPQTGVAAVPATLTVAGPLERLTLAPAAVTKVVGADETYTVTGHYAGGATVNLTQDVVYASDDAGVAVATNEAGNRSRVTAVGAGVATISATDPQSGVSTTDSGDDAVMTVQ
jgi:hypothetical protein